MGQLLFKKIFWDALRDGTKRTTIRRWSAPRLKPGQRAWTPGVGWLAIESVEQIDRLENLTDAGRPRRRLRLDGRAARRAPHALPPRESRWSLLVPHWLPARQR
jgi:hypothetical protein